MVRKAIVVALLMRLCYLGEHIASTPVVHGNRYHDAIAGSGNDILPLHNAADENLKHNNPLLNHFSRQRSRRSETRLPSHITYSDIIPYHYDVWIRPEIYSSTSADFYFLGMVSMRFWVHRTTSDVLLQYGGQKITRYQLTAENQTSPYTIGITRNPDPEFDQIAFTIDQGKLQAGQSYSLVIQFEGKFFPGSDSYGFFLRGEKNDTYDSLMCGTSMQPYFARTVFPCLDEPYFKASFRIQISRPPHMMSLSNMPKYRETVDYTKGWITDHFKTSIKMPSYLVAFVMFPAKDFSHAKAPDTHDHGMDINFWVHEEYVTTIDPMVNFLPEIIHYFEDYFSLDIPLHKMDIFTMTEYHLGGMENPGLILVYDHILRGNMYNNLNLLTHELIHQWFGNLVTPASWKDTWISEGITTYLSIANMGRLFPDFNSPQHSFKMYLYMMVMRTDGGERSIPIYPEHLEDAHSMFDEYYMYIYYKGAAVVEIIHSTLGEELFKRCLRRFLNEYKYRSTSVESFIELVQEVSGGSLTTISLRPWLYQKGYPIVKVQHIGNTLALHAYHFMDDSCHGSSVEVENMATFEGIVPVSYKVVYQSGHIASGVVMLTSDNQPLTIELNQSPLSWYILNTDNLYYKVLYEADNWDALLVEANSVETALSFEDRLAFKYNTELFALCDWLPINYKDNFTNILCNVDHFGRC